MSGLLRICTAGSVDDGKSTLIGRLLYDSRVGLRGSGALGREGVEEPQRRADRLLAVHRRPARRARAGHHDRRRLPLLRDRAPQVHPRRHARATSSTRATWRPARRRPTSRSCWSTRATACACSRGATRGSRGCSASRTSCSPSTRWTWSDFDRARLRRHRRRLRRACCTGAELHADSDQRAARRQRHHAQRADAVVRRAERCSSTSRRSRSIATRPRKPFRFPVQLVLRPDHDFRGYAGQIVLGHRSASATRSRSGRRAARRRVKRIVTWDGDLDVRVRADVGDAGARGRDRHQPRRRARGRATSRSASRFEADVVWMDERPLDPGARLPAEAHDARP